MTRRPDMRQAKDPTMTNDSEPKIRAAVTA